MSELGIYRRNKNGDKGERVADADNISDGIATQRALRDASEQTLHFGVYRESDGTLLAYTGDSIYSAGKGRMRVRSITASISASYHMFSAPDAPAPTAMASSATKAVHGWMVPGAAIIPAKAVKITSDITRGFKSCT